MNITNRVHSASWRKRARERRERWSANAVAAKARKRMEQVPPDEITPSIPRPSSTPPYATISIAIGKERATFRVIRFDEKRLLCRGKVQAASSIGRRVALVLENML